MSITFSLVEYDSSSLSLEIIGCCGVIEERLDISMQGTRFGAMKSERERRKTARPRPVIENLCVKKEYRKSGVGIALLRACEKARSVAAILPP